MKVALLSAALICGLWNPAHAAELTPWVVDQPKSHLTFTGKQGEAPFTGEFKDFQSEIFFDKDHLDQSRVKITIKTGSATTGDKGIDENLPTAGWLNTQAFPEAVFTSTKLTSTGSDKVGIENYIASGDLTLLGITQKIEFPFSLKKEGDVTRAFSSFPLKRLDYKVGQSIDSEGRMVSNDITVNFDITAHQ